MMVNIKYLLCCCVVGSVVSGPVFVGIDCVKWVMMNLAINVLAQMIMNVGV